MWALPVIAAVKWFAFNKPLFREKSSFSDQRKVFIQCFNTYQRVLSNKTIFNQFWKRYRKLKGQPLFLLFEKGDRDLLKGKFGAKNWHKSSWTKGLFKAPIFKSRNEKYQQQKLNKISKKEKLISPAIGPKMKQKAYI